MCLTFEGELPSSVSLDYLWYKVRPYERAPLRCFSCQEFGHVAAVCTKSRICRRCGKTSCRTVQPTVFGRNKCGVKKEEAKCLL